MTRGILALGLLALGCSAGSDGGDDGGSVPPRPSSCDPETGRRGSYLMTATEIDGTCGPQRAALVQLGPATAPGGTDSTCMPLADGIWSEGNCKLETRTLCAFDDFEPGA